MISRFWWLNFLLIIFIFLLSVKTIDIWFGSDDIAGPDTIVSKKDWPDPEHITRPASNADDASIIKTKNIFSSSRKQVIEVMIQPKKKPEPVKVKIPKSAKKNELELAEKLGSETITLYGVMILENIKYAFVSNPDKDGAKKQVRRSEHDMIGEYSLDRILPKKILVSSKGKRFEVPLFKKKESEKYPEKGKNKKVKTAPRILSTANDKSFKKIEVKSMDNNDYIIVNTPFGKIKKRKKK
jgi:hypothetical protein